MKRPAIVHGNRIYLGPIKRDDVPLFTKWYADPEIYCYEGKPGLVTNEMQELEWYESQVNDETRRNFAIMQIENDSLIGLVSLLKLDLLHGTAELAISIGPREVRGKGYGSEAVRLALDYGFKHLSLYNISLWHVEFNERGHQAYLNAGFQVVARHRGRFLFDGKRYDTIWMDIVRDEFRHHD